MTIFIILQLDMRSTAILGLFPASNFVFCTMRYRHLFFDLDHTLWDFDANSRLTLHELYHEMGLESRGVHSFDLFHKNYLIHNDKLWERYRNGYIKVDELRWKRMWLTLLDFKI